MKYKLCEISKGIYFIEFENNYDLAMLFLRYQEYYESPKFKNKNFSIIDYMEWYSKSNKGSFTYATDWAGFNIPVHIIALAYVAAPDCNKYDVEMMQIYQKIKSIEVIEKSYLIGAVKGKSSTIKHEVAHGLYFVDEKYKREMDFLISELPKTIYKKIKTKLLKMGYCKDVIKDEIQAYLTQKPPYFDCITNQMQKPFLEFFKKYIKEIKLKI